MSLPPDPQQHDPPWGPLTTIAWTLTALLIGVLVASGFYAIWAGDQARPANAMSDGVLIAVGTFISTPVQLGIVVFASQLRRWQPVDYLGLVQPRRVEMMIALVFIIALNLLFDVILYSSGREVVPTFQVEAWRTAVDAGWLVWLLLAIIVVAPIGEEIVFRGFLYRGLAKPGWEVHAIGAIALAWALLHIQYDWLGTAQIFLAGLVLGWFRWASGSTLLTIAMHMLINLQSMIETWIKVEYFS